MKFTLLFGLLLSLFTPPVSAFGFDLQGAIIGAPMAQNGQLTSDERRALRERWEQASSDERATMRRALREFLRSVPPEEREMRRSEFITRWFGLSSDERERMRRRFRDQADNPDQTESEQNSAGRGFGRGFERRFDGGMFDMMPNLERERDHNR